MAKEKPETIACVCIGLAAERKRVELPKQWFVVFGPNEKAFERAWKGVARVYELPKHKIRFVDIAKCDIEGLCVPTKDEVIPSATKE